MPDSRTLTPDHVDFHAARSTPLLRAAVTLPVSRRSRLSPRERARRRLRAAPQRRSGTSPHSPSQRVGHSLTGDDVWRAHLMNSPTRFRASGLQPGQLVLLAIGNRAASVGAVSCRQGARPGRRVASTPARPSRRCAICSERFGAAAIVAASDSGIGAAPTRRRFSDGLDLIRARRGPRRSTMAIPRYPEADVRLDGPSEGDA